MVSYLSLSPKTLKIVCNDITEFTDCQFTNLAHFYVHI
jgi:hypothetical protein